MSVYQLKDGRWIVQHEKGKDPERPTANKKYFGMGFEAERAARDFDDILHTKKKRPIPPPFFVDLANEFLLSKQQVLAKTTMVRCIVWMKGTILPNIGTCAAAELTPQRLEKYSADRAKDGVKRTTIL